ncbi:MAG: hypothetical protein ABSB14_21500 [Candidatus Sulfotelmatobacter sp.]
MSSHCSEYQWARDELFGALARMMVEVKKKHVSHKAHNKPRRRFQYPLESWGHEERIPHDAGLSEAEAQTSS